MKIYLDYNSTTPVDKRVLDVMLPCFTETFGNAASKTHTFGWQAEELVKLAREKVAAFLNADVSEIIFTSGATESINLAIKGVAEAYHKKGNHILIASTEHKAVIDTCHHLSLLGKEISTVNVNRDGILDTEELLKSLREDTILVCVMQANNETGVIQPIQKIAEIVHLNGSLLFCDATQAAGKINVDVHDLHADLLCISAHKIYGPKGIGALYFRRKNPRVTLTGQIDGGGHERNLRSGTLNVPGIVGLGKACELATKQLWEDASRMSKLRTKLEQAISDSGKVFINGSIKDRIPNTTNLCFQGMRADEIISRIPEIAVATGSACTSALPEPSHVLRAMGLSREEAYSSIRFSLGRFTTEEEVDQTIKLVNVFIKKYF